MSVPRLVPVVLKMFPALIGPEKVDVPIGFSYERSSRVFIASAGPVAGAIIPDNYSLNFPSLKKRGV